MSQSEIPERYAGLNLPDLMELMHGIVYPEAVNLMPQTVGWQILAIWLVACGAIICVDLARKYRANRYRREAIRLINGIEQRDTKAAQEIAALVKRSAIAGFPRSTVASLTGEKWQHFLYQTSQQKLALDEVALLTRAAYDPSVQFDDVREVAIRWIRVHHA